MSKAVRWQIHFADINGTQYRVDIYDEDYSGKPVVLQAGETPFVTDEDADSNFFTPIRTQTGTLQVCTQLPSGGTISIDELLPANNLARPLQLLNLSNDSKIEWQGFLSCEAYNQAYVGVPENIDLSVIGMLEAMDSIEIGRSVTGVMQGGQLLFYALNQINTESGMSMVRNVTCGSTATAILSRYFDTSVFFETKESAMGVVVKGITCKELLSRICTFMGWTAREQGTEVYLLRAEGEAYVYTSALANLATVQWSVRHTNETSPIFGMQAALTWRGTGHQKSITQGAKSVQVVAQLSSFDNDISLPGFPGSTLTAVNTKTADDWNGGDPKNVFIDSIFDQNGSADPRVTFDGYYKEHFWQTSDEKFNWEIERVSTRSDFLSHIFLRKAKNERFYFSALNSDDDTRHYSGAAFVRYGTKDTQDGSVSSFEEGLYCALLPGITSNTNEALLPLFTLSSLKSCTLQKGTLAIDISITYIGAVVNSKWLSYASYGNALDTLYGMTYNVRAILKVGNYYWTGSYWSPNKSTFLITLRDDGVQLKLTNFYTMTGVVSFSLLPGVTCPTGGTRQNLSVLFEMIITKLDITFTTWKGITQSERDENVYFRSLNTHFKDEVSVDVPFATYRNNTPSPSLIQDKAITVGGQDYTSTIPYFINAYTTSKRPEAELLDRLATYYSKPRTTLELEVAHPTDAPLPLLRYNGINDGKVYLPMAESHDWKTGICRLTCMETPRS